MPTPINQKLGVVEDMHLVTAFSYLLYRIYEWQVKSYGEKNNPRLVTILTSSLFLFFNLLTVLLVVKALTGYKPSIYSGYALIGALIISLIIYLSFFYDDRFRAVIDKFASETITERKRRTRWCWVYVIATHAVFLASASLWARP